MSTRTGGRNMAGRFPVVPLVRFQDAATFRAGILLVLRIPHCRVRLELVNDVRRELLRTHNLAGFARVTPFLFRAQRSDSAPLGSYSMGIIRYSYPPRRRMSPARSRLTRRCMITSLLSVAMSFKRLNTTLVHQSITSRSAGLSAVPLAFRASSAAIRLPRQPVPLPPTDVLTLKPLAVFTK